MYCERHGETSGVAHGSYRPTKEFYMGYRRVLCEFYRGVPKVRCKLCVRETYEKRKLSPRYLAARARAQEKRKQRNRQEREKRAMERKAETPTRLECKRHGEHDQWYRTGSYGGYRMTAKQGMRCLFCSREKYYDRKNTPEYLVSRKRQAEKPPSDAALAKRDAVRRHEAWRVAERLRDAYGSAVAARYIERKMAGEKCTAFQVISEIVIEAVGPMSAKELRRVRILDELLSLPLTATEWWCQRCGVRSNESRFFDLDHIIQRAKFEKGSKKRDAADNLQVLCPNCHRVKSMSDDLSSFRKNYPGVG